MGATYLILVETRTHHCYRSFLTDCKQQPFSNFFSSSFPLNLNKPPLSLSRLRDSLDGSPRQAIASPRSAGLFPKSRRIDTHNPSGVGGRLLLPGALLSARSTFDGFPGRFIKGGGVRDLQGGRSNELGTSRIYLAYDLRPRLLCRRDDAHWRC